MKEKSTSAYRSICRTCHMCDRKEREKGIYIDVNDTITVYKLDYF